MSNPYGIPPMFIYMCTICLWKHTHIIQYTPLLSSLHGPHEALHDMAQCSGCLLAQASPEELVGSYWNTRQAQTPLAEQDTPSYLALKLWYVPSYHMLGMLWGAPILEGTGILVGHGSGWTTL